VLIALIIVLFHLPYEKTAHQVNFDFGVPYSVARLCRSEPQS
jgi:hypothetical protein